jgi:putative N6-adenine-specific DNA methylase
MIEKKAEKPKGKPIELKQTAVGSRRATAGPVAPARDSKAFWRHVRQQVQARDHGFVAVLPRELADLCRQELVGLGIEEPRISEAGVEFSGRLTACLQVNLWSRTASRVLCRLPHFRVGVVGELFHKTAAVQWEVWLNPSLPLLVQAHSLHSRLDHEGLIAETVLKAIQYRFREYSYPVPTLWTSPQGGGQADEGLSAQRVLVRLENNRCEISLDTSGRHLHQRGYRRQHGGAPMRETLAAAILLQVGWRGDRPLVDGLCGAGTVAIEAALLARGIAPGIEREFLFEKWPGHEAKTWDYLRRKAREAALPSVSAAIVAVDQERRVVKIARDNAARAGVADDIRWELADFLALQPGVLGLAPGLVVLDPPYGVRTEKGTDLPDLYRRLGRHLRESFPGWQVAVVSPSPELARGLGFRRQRLWHIPHGGLAICVCLATV